MCERLNSMLIQKSKSLKTFWSKNNFAWLHNYLATDSDDLILVYMYCIKDSAPILVVSLFNMYGNTLAEQFEDLRLGPNF
jgi:hypothetical protein